MPATKEPQASSLKNEHRIEAEPVQRQAKDSEKAQKQPNDSPSVPEQLTPDQPPKGQQDEKPNAEGQKASATDDRTAATAEKPAASEPTGEPVQTASKRGDGEHDKKNPSPE